MVWHVRPFADDDFPGFTEIHNTVFPELAESEAELRHEFATWNHDRYFLSRSVVAADDGEVVGWSTVSHMPDQFHPDKYGFMIGVLPAARRRGAGGTLYDAVLATLAQRDAVAARTDAQESAPDAIAFLERRGFVEHQRAWESRLDVASFDPDPFAAAPARAAEQGIIFTTLAEERARDPEVIHAVYDLFLVCSRDVPEIDPVTDVPFDFFLANEVDGPSPLADGFFLAKDGDHYVAVSNLYQSEQDETMIHQGLTGVLPAYRGRGIAMALKLLTADYARRHDKRTISTWNNTRNRAMLRINEAMGFQKKPVWIIFQKELVAQTAPTANDDR